MLYINALELINLAIQNDFLKEENGKVFVFRSKTSQSKEGWYLEDKDAVCKELMKDEKGQKVIIQALKDKGIDFVMTDYSWLSNVNNHLTV